MIRDTQQLLTLDKMIEYLKQERRLYLTKLDALEVLLGISPRTSELRKLAKEQPQEYNETHTNKHQD